MTELRGGIAKPKHLHSCNRERRGRALIHPRRLRVHAREREDPEAESATEREGDEDEEPSSRDPKDMTSVEVQRALAQNFIFARDFQEYERQEKEQRAKAEQEVEWSPLGEVAYRGRWLLLLLFLQSASSFILDANRELLQKYSEIPVWLGVCVGAGGNAGNQSALYVVRGLAVGDLDPSLRSFCRVVMRQLSVGVVLGLGIAVAGIIRVYLTEGSFLDAFAIAMALYAIVAVSTVIGSALPFALNFFGSDPANAGTSIQVLMDVFGVLITTQLCRFIFDGQFGTYLSSLLT